MNEKEVKDIYFKTIIEQYKDSFIFNNVNKSKSKNEKATIFIPSIKYKDFKNEIIN